MEEPEEDGAAAAALESQRKMKEALNQVGEAFECPICFDLFTEPLMLPCTHSMCRECAKLALKASKEPECPVCRLKVRRANAARNILTVSMQRRSRVRGYESPARSRHSLSQLQNKGSRVHGWMDGWMDGSADR